jgi:hypothetical protein
MTSNRVVFTLFPTLAVLLACGTARLAQDEAALKAAFERQRVTVRIDMPGSDDGVDVRVQTGIVSSINIDLPRYRNDLKRYGTAIRAGDSAMVTLVKVKKDIIEFQLDGGGFGTFGDNASTSSNIPLVDKTAREKTLENQLKTEKDADKRRSMQSELDRLRDRREFENRRIRRSASATRKSSGSAWPRIACAADRVSTSATRTACRPACTWKTSARRWASSSTSRAPPRPRRSTCRRSSRRGFAKACCGPTPRRHTGALKRRRRRRSGEFTVVTLVFVSGEQRITADFVEDVLVRYSIASK